MGGEVLPQLSFANLDQPYFHSLSKTASPLEQMRLAAEHGFPAMFDQLFLQRPEDEQRNIADAVARHGVAISSISTAPDFRAAPWSSPAPDDRAQLARVVEIVADKARQVGASLVVLYAVRDRLAPIGQQIYAFGENLRRLAPLAERAGVTLCVEPASPARAPDGMIHRLVDGYTVVRLADSPAVKLAFDVYHVAQTDGDIIGNLRWTASEIALIQLSDSPGRIEPGSGEHDFARIISAAMDVGFQGFFELEHFFSTPGRHGLELALSRLRGINAVVSRLSPAR